MQALRPLLVREMASLAYPFQWPGRNLHLCQEYRTLDQVCETRLALYQNWIARSVDPSNYFGRERVSAMTKKFKLMAILAHPDDESLGFGGTLTRYAAEDVEIHLVTATRGERGRSGSVGKEVEQSEVGRLREGELRAAAAVLGVQSVAILGYPDGGVDQVDPAIAMPALVQHIRRIRPHVVVTFGPEGAYGHPDHIAISQLTTAASMCAGDASYHSDHGSQSETLPAHRIAKLYYLAWPNDKWDAYQAAFRKFTSLVDGVPRQAVPWPDWAVTRVIDTSLLACRLESRMLPPDSDVHLRTAGAAHARTTQSALGFSAVLPRLQLCQRRPQTGDRPV